jgi:glycosyltransferase involved in cell wall biosynthesis
MTKLLAHFQICAALTFDLTFAAAASSCSTELLLFGMRILLIHNRYQQAGGEDGVVKAERALLESNGHEVDEFSEDNHRIDSMNRFRVAARTLWSAETWHHLGEIVGRFRPDIAHVHNTFPLISPSAYHLLQNRGVPVVQTLHNYRLLCPKSTFYREGHVCESCLGRSFPWPGVRYSCYRENRGASATIASMLFFHRLINTWNTKIDTYIALTQFARDKFIEGGLPPDRIVVKPVFVPDYGIGAADGGYAIFVGRLAEEKGICTLLEAWKVLGSRVPLKIIGGGPLADKVKSRVADIPGVSYLGRVADDVLQETFSRASFTVFPSLWYEGMPAVILESYAAGLPVISSRLGSMASMVKEGETGYFFKPGHAGALVQAVDRLCTDAAGYHRMRDVARREYEQNYTPDANYQALISIYRSVTERSRSSSRA